MEDMWRSREPPIPLSFDGIKDGSFDIIKHRSMNKSNEGSTSENQPKVNGSTSNGSSAKPSGSAAIEALLNGSSSKQSSSSLKDQRELSLQDNLELFVSRSVEPRPNVVPC